MKYHFLPVTLCVLLCVPVYAQDIDLECEALANQMIERLTAEGLLVQQAETGQRARSIGLSLCGGAEASAQQQHEAGKQEALDNWFFEKQPDKAGNRRLRNLKR
mgnify:CR=1 FL=1